MDVSVACNYSMYNRLDFFYIISLIHASIYLQLSNEDNTT